MNTLKNILFSSCTLFFVGISIVNADEQAIRKSMSQSLPSLKIDSIKPSEIDGLFEVTIGTNVIYASGDGKYMLQGHLIDIESRKDLTELRLAESRKLAMEKLGEDKMIIFKPGNSKHKVTIFTDIDCGYCRKLHSEIDQYMAEGITVQYLFYPRAGKGSDSYNKAVSVWCAEDKKIAFTNAKKGKSVATKTCKNPIDEHMALAEDFEVRGTPMIVTQKGSVLPGYVPAQRLIQALNNENRE